MSMRSLRPSSHQYNNNIIYYACYLIESGFRVVLKLIRRYLLYIHKQKFAKILEQAVICDII